ncbi:O-antigen ligase family protein [Arthrobacter nitrophenolicus]|uniref:O-antigen ligase n=2 Tax=Arthrobacter nitrophenolicus TaxID=683150 RepID=A0ACC6TDF9_9MICC|nr:O-antigen polymerase [Arthrobacter nitrophenolicus]ELT45957.1 O-antigen polymerase [Arthrobacter nitrophenolicus]
MILLSAAVASIFFVLPFSEALPAPAFLAWTGFVLAGIVGTVVLGYGKQPKYQGIWIASAFLALVGAVSASGETESLRGHLLYALQIIVFIAFGPFAIKCLAAKPGLAAKAVAAFLLGQSISAGAAVAQASGMTVFGWKSALGRAPGLAGHPNIIGVLSGVAIVLFLFLIFKTKQRKLPLLCGLALNVAGLFISGSISALIACAIGVLIFMIAARVSFKVILTMATVVGAALWGTGQLAAAGLLRGPAQRIAQVTGQTHEKSTLDIRQYTYEFAWQGIQRDPFYGRGLDTGSGATYDNITVTHNILLRAWYQGGLGTGLAIALIVAAIAWLIAGALFHGKDAASAGVLAVIIGFSMTSAALQQGYFWLLILGAWALLASSTADNQRGQHMSLAPAEKQPLAA